MSSLVLSLINQSNPFLLRLQTFLWSPVSSGKANDRWLLRCFCSAAASEFRRSERLLERRRKQAQFRDPQESLDNFDFCQA